MKSVGHYLQGIKNVICDFTDSYIKEFIRHNKIVWKPHNNYGLNNEILVPFGGFPRTVVTWAYFSNVFAECYSAKILSYGSTKKSLVGYQDKKICQSYGCVQNIFVSLSLDEEKKCKKKAENIFRNLTTKEELINLYIDDIEVGMEVYDSYLRMGEPTVNLKDVRLKALIEDAVKMIFFWRQYFTVHKVKVFIADTEHYMQAIVGTVAAACGVKVYAIGMGHGVKLTKRYAWNENFKYYHKLYQQLPGNLQAAGIQWAKRQLKRRLNGEVGVDMEYVTKSAFSQASNFCSRALNENKTFKVLIAAHDFFDSPHGFGEKHLFPDFYEWLCHLGEIAQNTPYEWYIKVHPDESEQTIGVIRDLINIYPKLQWVDKNIPHQQLVAEGIRAVLTVYGTVGCEYPLFGIPVINAGYNPHIAYNFNLHPKTIQEYDSILYHLDEVKIDYSIDEIYEFYFVHHIFGLDSSTYRYRDDLVVPSIRELTKMTAGDETSSKVYHLFLQSFTQEWHIKTIKKVKEYIRFMDEFAWDKVYVDESCLRRIYERIGEP